MIAVGVRELKNKLSEYLRLARAGERVLITDRGHVVAELGQPGIAAGAEAAGLLGLIRSGEARGGGANRSDLYPALPPVLAPGEAARLLDAERDGR